MISISIVVQLKYYNLRTDNRRFTTFLRNGINIIYQTTHVQSNNNNEDVELGYEIRYI